MSEQLASRVPEEECPECGLTLQADQVNSGHHCLKSVVIELKQLTKLVRENDELITSQNLLIAKLIKENEENKQKLDKLTELTEEVNKLRAELDHIQEQNQLNDSTEVVQVNGTVSRDFKQKVSKKHESIIVQLKNENIIQSDKVYNIMLSVDFRDFNSGDGYLSKRFVCILMQLANCGCSWQTNKVRFFERYVHRVREGSKVLYMFSNAYVAVCLALIVGPQGEWNVTLSQCDSNRDFRLGGQ